MSKSKRAIAPWIVALVVAVVVGVALVVVLVVVVPPPYTSMIRGLLLSLVTPLGS